MQTQSTSIRLQRYENKYSNHHKDLMSDSVLSNVLTRGYCVIPNYWSSDRCQMVRNMLDELIDNSSNNGIRIWTDQLCADKRVMGADRLSSELDIFSDKQIFRYISALYGVSSLQGFTMAARLNYVSGNLGSGQGWHRDSCVEHQYKAILYLSDVTTELGPFQYLRGSGNADAIVQFGESTGIDLEENRLDNYECFFDEQDIDDICGLQGTLVIANTRGIHRGKPLMSGSRYALTNYYWKTGIPKHIQPYMNDIGPAQSE